MDNNPKNNFGDTTLLFVAREGHAKVSLLILAKTEEKNPQKNGKVETPLDMAKKNCT